jgi:hypothetical protein
MWRRTVVTFLTAAVLAGTLWVGLAIAQEPAREGRWPRDPEQMRQRMAERMRESLGATEDEWKVLGPRIEKVQQLMRQSRGVGFVRGRRPGEGRRAEGAPEREQSEVEKKAEALRSLLDDEASGAEAITAALDALRKAREKAQEDLAAARKELREVVTARQEARLVLMGILD